MGQKPGQTHHDRARKPLAFCPRYKTKCPGFAPLAGFAPPRTFFLDAADEHRVQDFARSHREKASRSINPERGVHLSSPKARQKTPSQQGGLGSYPFFRKKPLPSSGPARPPRAPMARPHHAALQKTRSSQFSLTSWFRLWLATKKQGCPG